MNEKLLQYIWQFQYFNKSNLVTAENDALSIINVGTLNTNQGPDFFNARIKINNIILSGNIEIHTKASQWILHQHSNDKNYKNIILHIVWENDIPIKDDNNTPIPTLELKNIVPKVLIEKYIELMEATLQLPCNSFLPCLSQLGWTSWKERLTTERLLYKSSQIQEVYKKNNNNWEETMWQLLAYNFGLKVNATFFQQVAETISNNILSKHKNRIHQLEAMLLGQANLLNDEFQNDYPLSLKKEYIFLKRKYNLNEVKGSALFLRMRPANFPTIRLAQLAALISNSSHLFSKIKEIETISELQNLFNINCSSYWNYHYTFFDNPSDFDEKKLGKQTIDNIIINTIIPIFFSYGWHHNDDELKLKSINWLHQIKPEKNKITKEWEILLIENKSAFDSQALIELTNSYCSKKKCLECAVGNNILKENIFSSQ